MIGDICFFVGEILGDKLVFLMFDGNLMLLWMVKVVGNVLIGECFGVISMLVIVWIGIKVGDVGVIVVVVEKLLVDCIVFSFFKSDGK